MKKLLISFSLVFMLGAGITLHAQEFDGALGFGTITAPAAGNGLPSQSGGLYMSFSGNFRFWMHHHFGFGGEVAPRVRRALYGLDNGSGFVGAIPYRPIFYDFNAVYGATSIKKRIGGDVMAGIGGEDMRFYSSNYTCGFTGCTNYSSSNHFAWHLGGDVRIYVWGHAFVRPEAHYYIMHNGGDVQGVQAFNNGNIARYAISIGYSFLPGF